VIPSGEPFFFHSSGRRLFGLWQGATSETRSTLLYCHPFGEEKKTAHRAFVEAARSLAAQGVGSLRFDMTGCGDSEGDFADARLAHWLEDIASAWGELARREPGVPRGLLGLRMGASLAAMACGRLEDVSALILWQPIIAGKAEFISDLRRLLVQQMMTGGKAGAHHKDAIAALERGDGKVELDGYAVACPMYKEICAIDLHRIRSEFPAKCGVVQFSRPQRNIEAFLRAAKIPGIVVDLPPIWPRTDFIPESRTGELLAREGVMRWL